MTTSVQERREKIRTYLDDLSEAMGKIDTAQLACAADLIEGAYSARRTIFTCGNGGSAATASHLAVDLGKNTRVPGAAPVHCISLVDHVPALTAWANDVGYESVFSGQLEGLISPGDVLVVISTSGNSRNILAALRSARQAQASTVGLLGATGGAAYALCAAPVVAPAGSIEEQEDLHMAMAHILTHQLRAFIRNGKR